MPLPGVSFLFSTFVEPPSPLPGRFGGAGWFWLHSGAGFGLSPLLLALSLPLSWRGVAASAAPT